MAVDSVHTRHPPKWPSSNMQSTRRSMRLIKCIMIISTDLCNIMRGMVRNFFFVKFLVPEPRLISDLFFIFFYLKALKSKHVPKTNRSPAGYVRSEIRDNDSLLLRHRAYATQDV